jgi:hypothetical protein
MLTRMDQGFITIIFAHRPPLWWTTEETCKPANHPPLRQEYVVME